MNNLYVTSFGRDSVKSHCIERKLGWPLYAWKALVPESVIRELDVLQKLILSLAQIGRLKDHSVFGALALPDELVKAIKKTCIDSGYLDDNGEITDRGKDALLYEKFNTSDQEATEQFSRIYVFRDALTGDIVPNFSIAELPRGRKDLSDRWFLQEDKYYKRKPSFNDIAQALKHRGYIDRHLKNIRRDYATDEVDPSAASMELPFDLTKDDEMDWETIDKNGEVSTSREESGSTNQRATRTAIPGDSYIKIWDETPELIYADAAVYVDPDLPNRQFVMSPFGTHENQWFTNHMHIHASRDKEVGEELRQITEIAMLELQEKYPLNNQLDIGLFVEFPAIANLSTFAELREQLESVKRAYNRISDGHQDYDTFFMRCQRTLECLLDECIATVDRREKLVPEKKGGFGDRILHMAGQLSVDLPRNYTSPQFADRMGAVARKRGMSSKDRALFLLIVAYERENSPALAVLKDMPEFYHSINLIADVRNKTAHYSTETIDNDRAAGQVMDQLERLVRVLFSHFLRR